MKKVAVVEGDGRCQSLRFGSTTGVWWAFGHVEQLVEMGHVQVNGRIAPLHRLLGDVQQGGVVGRVIQALAQAVQRQAQVFAGD